MVDYGGWGRYKSCTVKTYPIYEATFSGSSDYCACPVIRVAARRKRDACRRFRQIEQRRWSPYGRVMALGESGGYIPEKIEPHVRLLPDKRATDLSFEEVVSPFG